MENAERQVRQAIKASPKLQDRGVTVFVQGSYRNRVNVRQESDVDIGVVCTDAFFTDFSADDNVKESVNRTLSDSTYTYATFKNEVEQALVSRFGRAAVVRGPKSFDVEENTYRVEADVTPFFEHRRYTSAEGRYLSGVELRPDDSNPLKVINWPEQHYENEVAKNSRTGRRFKAMVRVLKSLRNEMAENDVKAALPIPSFLVECLVWNAPEHCFGHSTYREDLREALAHLFNNTLTDAECSEWGEVSELKYLFRSSPKWTRQQAHDFLNSAWDYVGFE